MKLLIDDKWASFVRKNLLVWFGWHVATLGALLLTPNPNPNPDPNPSPSPDADQARCSRTCCSP